MIELGTSTAREWAGSVFDDAYARRRNSGRNQNPPVVASVVGGKPFTYFKWRHIDGCWCWWGLVRTERGGFEAKAADYWVELEAMNT